MPAAHILLVDDERSIADNIVMALKRDGIAVDWKATGVAGAEACTGNPPDLAILDIGLPDIDGFEVFRRIRARCPDLPVIFLTARAEEIDRIVGLEMGADDYIAKPFSPRELCARVKAILRRTGPDRSNGQNSSAQDQDAAPKLISAGNFVVDEARCEIRFRNAPVKMSRYEYRIMKTLIAHPGRIFSRRQLMNAVWEDPDVSMERTVDTHVKTLRAKMAELLPRDEVIVTQRGFGYSFNERLAGKQ